MVSSTVSVPSINKPNYAMNKVLAHLEPYLREIKPDIAGFHIFEEGNTELSPNVQKTSLIFVANTELARKKGVHFNIPGKLMNVFFVDGQNKEGKIKFKADSIVKPLTIVVSDYVLHINICYDLPSKPQIKTVGTQTKKRYVLSSSVDDNIPIYKIESFLLSDLQVKPEQKCTQTDSSILTEHSQSSQMNIPVCYQDTGIQTVFFKDQMSCTSSSDKKCYSFGGESGLNTDEGNTKTESFENSSKQTIDYENSMNSFISYDSHTHLYQTTVLNNMKDGKVYKTASLENNEIKVNTEGPINTDRNQEKNTLTLFDNSSNYNSKIMSISSHNVFKSIEPIYFGNSTVSNSTKSASFEEDRSETSVKTAHSENGLSHVRSSESTSNVSIKDIKERLNKTTLSLQQLYSVIELLEKKSDNRSTSETTDQTAGYIEREDFENKIGMSRQTSLVMTSQVTLDKSSGIDSSDQSFGFQETSLKSNQSNSTTSDEKSLRDYKDTSSLDILCERCGSFHSNVGFEVDCKIFDKKNTKQSENKNCQGSTNSGSSTSQVNFSKNSSAIANTFSDEIESLGSSDHFSNEMESYLETNIKDSTMSCEEHNNYLSWDEISQNSKPNKHKESKLLETDKDDLDNCDLNMTVGGQKIVVYSEGSKQSLVDNNKNHKKLKIDELLEKISINRNELKLGEILNFDQNVADFDRAFKVNTSISSQTLRQIKGTSHDTISTNRNCISEECIEKSSEPDNSTQSLTGSSDALEQNNRDPSYNNILSNQSIELIGDNKAVEKYNDVQNLEVSDQLNWLSETNNCIQEKSENSSNIKNFRNENKTEAKANSKILYFTEVRNTKSWISFKKSEQSCNHNEKLGLKERITNSEPITNLIKIKNLSSGDHVCQNVVCKISSSLEERLNTVGLYNNKSNFLNYKNSSSSSTLHIIPSSQELVKLKSQENSFQGREFLKKAVEKVNRKKSPNFEKWYGKSRGNCKKKDGNLECTTGYSQYIESENKTNIKTSNNFKTAKTITQKKKNSKHKKSKLFCFFK